MRENSIRIGINLVIDGNLPIGSLISVVLVDFKNIFYVVFAIGLVINNSN